MNVSQLFNDLLFEINDGWQPMNDKPEETPENTLRALWCLACGDPKAVEYCCDCDLPTLSPKRMRRLRKLLQQRQAGIPLAHLTGRQCFMEMEMLAGPEALIPRKETELLGYAALEITKELSQSRKSVTIIDLCTGCGNLALALACYNPTCRVYGADLSEDAVLLARKNAEHLNPATPVEFRVGDLFAPFDEDTFWHQVDVIVCNPPYISTQHVDELPEEIGKHEPQLAFDGGPFGIGIIFRLIKETPRYLKPKSWLCFEVGVGQGKAVFRKIRQDEHYDEIRSVHDSQGQIRALLARTV